ncbi:MAG: Re/Si-specific NAD(P)(+) transhydrogenase subunit alpha [Ectothiorhodospiraceae bacterium]|nr:Re/Si-specific NAD(P)(+) transhydrogenase subunit alpha [Chromatiales bacterium]MCP5157546.1 Re/Si-specific NAD(P)(+) transhydrogenase subunit alpha [Ectothiorhodospiraceae bacterium]
MLVAVARERGAGETRVAATPDSVKRMVGLGLSVRVEAGAGAGASFADDAYREAGAEVATDPASLLAGADGLLTVGRPAPEIIEHLRPGAFVIGLLVPYADTDDLRSWAGRGLTLFSMELVPRISRAQSMDVLSSQSNLAGYKAVIDAAAEFHRAMPMMMTAAGTIAPAKVFVLGAGVAGLQAIATARRLGAVVSATDVRPAVKEQVESLGANFVMVDSEETRQAETAGGYAREMSDDYKRKQAALVAATLAKQDIVITTALIPGRPAPVLVTEEMVESMRPGSVIVDLAVEQGGNCPLSRPGEIVEHHGVRIMGHRNVPGRIPVDASSLYARNLYNFLAPFVDKASGEVRFDWDDEIVRGSLLARDGQAVHKALGAGD